MKINLLIECESVDELLAVAAGVHSGVETFNEVNADAETVMEVELTGIPDCVDPASVTAPPETTIRGHTAEENAAPKKRGRKPKPQPDEIVASAVKATKVLDDLKASVNATTPASVEDATDLTNVVPLTNTKPVSMQPDVSTPDTDIKTGQDLQDYIMALIYQHRLDPVVIRTKVYPKYGIARSLDLTAEQVPLVKADIDAMLKPQKAPSPTADDLAL